MSGYGRMMDRGRQCCCNEIVITGERCSRKHGSAVGVRKLLRDDHIRKEDQKGRNQEESQDRLR